MEGRRLGEHLDPVAGGDQHRLGDVLALQQVVQQLLGVVGADGGAFEHRRGSGPVVQTDDEQAHRTSTCSGGAGSGVRRPVGASRRATRLVEGQDLELDREVDLPEFDVRRGRSAPRARS